MPEGTGPINRALPAGLRGAVVATVAATILGSAAGALLPFAITYVFEPGQTDPYFLTTGSLLAVASMITVVLRGTIVPFAMSWRASGAATTWRTANKISWRMASAGTVLAIIAVGCLVLLVIPHSRLTHEASSVVLQCALCLVPLPALMAYCSVLCGLLYSAERFFFATWSETFRSLLAGIVVLLPVAGKPIWAVSAALTVGEGVRALLLRVAARKSLGLRSGGLEHCSPQPLTRYWRVALIQVLSLSIVGLSPIIDKAFASGQPAGSVTALELAEKLFYTPMMLLASGVGLVVGTRWARMAEAEQWADLVHDHRRWQLRLALGSTAVAVACIVCVYAAEPLLYRALSIPHTIDFAWVFAAYAVGLPFAMAGNLGGRLFVSCKSTGLLPLFAIALLVINIIGDAIGVSLLGLTGIAFASSAYRLVDAVLYLSFAGYVIRSARAWKAPAEVALHRRGEAHAHQTP
jgi:peptidoglycan biosynthesis protein MviN/MurJ (putative lipid II flippase)